MTIITLSFIQEQLKFVTKQQIKAIIQRQRLKLSYDAISFYVWCIFMHQTQQTNFKTIYKRYNLNITYQAFMHDIILISPLIKFLFYKNNKILNIKPSSLYNIVDSSLIPIKNPEFINQQDYDLNKVTARTKDKIKVKICGIKLFIFLNRFNKIYHAELLNINYSDQNILKSSALYLTKLKGFLLADRGFGNKVTEQRVNSTGICKLLTPGHYKSKKFLTKKEKKLYKKRWKIETLFQKLKNNYGEFKLNLRGAKNKGIIEAKLFISLMNYNLSNMLKT